MSGRAIILVIDDDRDILDLVSAQLAGRDGHVVLTADTGEEGLLLAGSEQPDLILLDWMMPEPSGMAVLKTLKGERQTKHIPVYMLTALRAINDVEQAMAEGAAGYFSKPVNLVELSASVRDFLSGA